MQPGIRKFFESQGRDDITEGAPDRYYSVSDLARILKVTPQTIYNNIGNGRIKTERKGKEYRFSAEEVTKLIKNGYGKY